MTVGGYLIAVGVAASVLLALAVALWLQARGDRRDQAELDAEYEAEEIYCPRCAELHDHDPGVKRG